MGDEEISEKFRLKLQQNLDDLQSIATKVLNQKVEQQGHLVITIMGATADILASNKSCDYWSPPCDSYIKVYINSELIGQTPVIWDTKYTHIVENIPYNNRTFKSPKISKNASVSIEMLDYDSVYFLDNDHIILSWNTTVRELLENGKLYTIYGIQENEIDVRSSWEEEPIQFENDKEKYFYLKIFEILLL